RAGRRTRHRSVAGGRGAVHRDESVVPARAGRARRGAGRIDRDGHRRATSPVRGNSAELSVLRYPEDGCAQPGGSRQGGHRKRLAVAAIAGERQDDGSVDEGYTRYGHVSPVEHWATEVSMEPGAHLSAGLPDQGDLNRTFSDYAKAARGTAIKNHTKGDAFGET